MGLWTKKSLDNLQESIEAPKTKLNRSLSTFDLILLGIGAIIGAGLFSITGIAAAENAGPSIVISFVIAAIACMFAGLCYCEMAAMIPVSGSAYTYTYASLGQFPAWVIGWSLVLEYAIGAATVAISWSAYCISLIHKLGVSLPTSWIASPWQPVMLPDGSQTTGLINLPAIFIVMAVSGILISGIKSSAIVNACIVCIKLSAVFAFIAIGIFYIDPANYVPFIPANTGVFGEYGWSGIMRGAGVVFFAYIGFDALSTTSQETKNPYKSMPRGILGSLFICTIIYILFAFVMTGLANYKTLDVAAPVAVAIAKTPYPWLQWMMQLAILAGLTSVVLAFLLGQSRVFYIMACDGLLPKCFAELHPVLKTPWQSNLILMVFVGLIAGLAPITLVGHMTSIGTLLAFATVCAAVIIMRYTHPDRPRPFKVPAFPLVPIIGILICVGMMSSLGLDSWMRLIIWLAIGLVIYFTYSIKQK